MCSGGAEARCPKKTTTSIAAARRGAVAVFVLARRVIVDAGTSNTHYLCMSTDTHIYSGPIPEDQVDLAVEVFRMLADATRVRLLWELLDRELPVNDLAAAVRKPPNAVSQHLAKLRMARLVRARRKGTFVFYRIENDHVRQLVRDAISHADHASGGIHHLRAVDDRDAQSGRA